MSQAAVGSFGEDLVRSLSSSRKEPDWLAQARLDAFKEFIALPPERNPLYTKYVGTFGFSLDKYGLDPEPGSVDLRTFFGGVLSGKERNILLQGNDSAVHADLDADLASQKVKLLSIHDALEEDGALVKRLFAERLLKSGTDKFAAFVNAFFNSGTVVHIPSGAQVDRPLRKMLLLDSPKSSIIDQTFIVAEEGSKVVFLEELYSKGSAAPSLLASNTEVIARVGAQVDYSSIQLLDEQAAYLSNRAIGTSNDARATVSALSLGSAATRSRMNFLLNGRGSFGEGFEIFFTDQKQKFDFETNLIHNSPDSTGSTQARGVLKGESQSIFKGMIKIVNAAKNSRSYLAHHAMLLERTARSDAVPSLEIENNEVRATHSASVAQVDDEQLFYLMARGLPLDEAKKTIVLGFFEPVLSRIPIEQTREGARFMIEGKWQGKKRRLLDREALLAATGEITPEVKQSEDIFERHYKYR